MTKASSLSLTKEFGIVTKSSTLSGDPPVQYDNRKGLSYSWCIFERGEIRDRISWNLPTLVTHREIHHRHLITFTINHSIFATNQFLAT